MASDIHFDPFEEDALADPGAAYGALRAACPFHHQPAQAGRPDYYVLSDHAEIKTDILQGNPIWSFRFGNAMKDSISDVGFKTDGDFHAAFRMPGKPRAPATEPMLMMAPPPRALRCGIAAFTTRNTPKKLVSISRAASASVSSSTAPTSP